MTSLIDSSHGRTSSFVLFLSLTFIGIAGADPACPAPSVMHRGQCVLLADAVLDTTIRVPSETTLNCRGYRLTPAVAGVPDDPRSTTNEFQASQPALAILLHRASGTKIQNCVIEGFDFGILVLDNKTPPGLSDGEISHRRNKILSNSIDVRTNAIGIARADNTLIADNELTYASERGRGVVLEFDSDDNEILRNTVTSTDAASTGQVQQVPGGPFVVAQTAIMDNGIHCLMADRALRNVVVDGELIQIRLADESRNPNPDPATIEDSLRTDHNLIEGNTIVDLGHGLSCTLDPGIPCRSNPDCPAGKGPCLLKQSSGIGFNVRAGDTVVRGNSISGRMERGVSFGGVATTFTNPSFYPGTCTGDPEGTRMCVEDVDCNIAGLPALGTCSGVSSITFNGNTVRLAGEDNVLTGIYGTAALFANNNDGFSYRGNLVQSGTATPAGIQISSTAINGTVERNVVNGTASALFLLGRPAAITYSIRLNDFSGYVDAIRTSNDFNLATTLGGNYWGAPCPGLDPNRVRFANGNVNPHVTDVSYGVPVAATPDELLPAPCP